MVSLKVSASALVLYGVNLALAQTNDGIKLAISPTCKTLSTTGATGDANAGLLTITQYKTIVAFGDSYSSGGKHDGSTQAAAVLVPPEPRAGGRTTNGPVWIENVANDIGATFKDYAVASSVTSLTVWPASKVDFLSQLNVFLGQNNTLNPDTTLYTIYLGINDWIASHKTDNGTALLPQAAQVILDKVKLLSSPPTNAKSFLIADSYGLGRSDAQGDAWKKKIFNGLASLRAANSNLRFGYVDLGYIWYGVLGTTPGYQAFGYTSTGNCLANSSTTAGACSDPNHTLYWIPSHPSKQTHRIMADYTKLVLSTCH